MMIRNELASLILMKRICPKETQAYHIKEGIAECLDSLSEIGFYSSVLFNAKEKKVRKRTIRRKI